MHGINCRLVRRRDSVDYITKKYKNNVLNYFLTWVSWFRWVCHRAFIKNNWQSSLNLNCTVIANPAMCYTLSDASLHSMIIDNIPITKKTGLGLMHLLHVLDFHELVTLLFHRITLIWTAPPMSHKLPHWLPQTMRKRMFYLHNSWADLPATV